MMRYQRTHDGNTTSDIFFCECTLLEINVNGIIYMNSVEFIVDRKKTNALSMI